MRARLAALAAAAAVFGTAVYSCLPSAGAGKSTEFDKPSVAAIGPSSDAGPHLNAGAEYKAVMPADLPANGQALQAELEMLLGVPFKIGSPARDIKTWCAARQGCADLAACTDCMRRLKSHFAAAPPNSETARVAAALMAASGDVQAIRELVEKIRLLSEADAVSASNLMQALPLVNRPEAAGYFGTLIAGGLDSAAGRHLDSLHDTLLQTLGAMDDQPLVGAYLADVYESNTAESARERLIQIRNAQMLSHIAQSEYQVGNYAQAQRAVDVLVQMADDGRAGVLGALADYSRKTGVDVNLLARDFGGWSAKATNVSTSVYAVDQYADILASPASGYHDKVLAAAALGALGGQGGEQALRKLLDQGTDAATLAIAGQELQRLQAGGGR